MRDPPPAAIDDPPVLGNIYVSGDPDILRDTSLDITDESRLRIYAGHAEWAPGQLSAEIAEGSWVLMPGRPDLVFSPDPLRLWRDLESSTSELVVDVGRHVR